MKRLIKPIMFLAAVQLIMMLLGRLIKGRYLSQEIGEEGCNGRAVPVTTTLASSPPSSD